MAGPFVYIHFVEGPAPAQLALPASGGTGSATTSGWSGTAPSSTGSFNGVWHVGSGSVVGYRVGEVLIGQHATAVGRLDPRRRSPIADRRSVSGQVLDHVGRQV